jgi:hypothetical protein
MNRDAAAINTSREIDKVAISVSNDCNTPAHICSLAAVEGCICRYCDNPYIYNIDVMKYGNEQ